MNKEFDDRFKKFESELKSLYTELYDINAYNYFVSMLYRLWEERAEELKKTDRMREESPTWYKDNNLVGMQMYVNAFAGNLKGLERHLDYIEDCNVNYLHLMPILESPKKKSDGGYAVSNFCKVQEELGTMQDLSRLSSSCHKKGICICLDFVMNHTSDEHIWAKKAKSGNKEFQNYYFFYDNWEIPNQFERTVPQVFPVSAPGNFSWCEEAGKVVMTTFYPYQWDLNYSNSVVFNNMTENMLNLCNNGVDIIRLDAVPYIWKQIGTSCRNLPQVHTLVRIMRIVCEIVCPGTLLLGEVVMETDKVVPYFGSVEKPECHLLYNVTTMATLWHTVATKDVRLMAHQIQRLNALPKEYTFLNYVRCHDDIGWGLDYAFLSQFCQQENSHKKFLNDYFTGNFEGSFARGELYNNDLQSEDARLCGTTASLCGMEVKKARENAIKMHVMLHAFIFTLNGIPVLYSGDEIGQKNNTSYHKDPLKAEDSRYLHRGNMNWDNAEKRKLRTSTESKIFKSIKKIEKIHSENRCFHSQALVSLFYTGNNSVLGIKKEYGNQILIALFNFTDIPQIIMMNGNTEYKDLWLNKNSSLSYAEVRPCSFRWLVLK